MQKLLLSFLFLLAMVMVEDGALASCSFSSDAQGIINYSKIPTTNIQDKCLSGTILTSKKLVVYGEPFGDKKGDQYRYLGYTYEGNKYANYWFPHDLDATKSVAKNWVKEPWKVISSKGLQEPMNNRHPDATKWLNEALDPYNPPSGKWLASFNKITGLNWSGADLLPWVMILQAPTDWSPAQFQMWNDGSGKWSGGVK